MLLKHYRTISWMLECFPDTIAEELDRPFEGIDELGKGRFAAAVLAHDSDIFAVVDLHIDILEQLTAYIIRKIYLLQLNHGYLLTIYIPKT